MKIDDFVMASNTFSEMKKAETELERVSVLLGRDMRNIDIVIRDNGNSSNTIEINGSRSPALVTSMIQEVRKVFRNKYNAFAEEFERI
jgi:hypothetical protein